MQLQQLLLTSAVSAHQVQLLTQSPFLQQFGRHYRLATFEFKTADTTCESRFVTGVETDEHW